MLPLLGIAGRVAGALAAMSSRRSLHFPRWHRAALLGSLVGRSECTPIRPVARLGLLDWHLLSRRAEDRHRSDWLLLGALHEGMHPRVQPRSGWPTLSGRRPSLGGGAHR